MIRSQQVWTGCRTMEMICKWCYLLAQQAASFLHRQRLISRCHWILWIESVALQPVPVGQFRTILELKNKISMGRIVRLGRNMENNFCIKLAIFWKLPQQLSAIQSITGLLAKGKINSEEKKKKPQIGYDSNRKLAD